MTKRACLLLPAFLLLAAPPTGGLALSEDEKEIVATLALSTLPPLAPDPTNRLGDDPAASAFGATLFFDTRLSGNGEVSCATCHRIDRQFQDGLPRAVAIGRTDRSTMPLAGVAHDNWFFWDGRKDSLWSQSLGPLEDSREHGGNRTAYVRFIAGAFRERYERIFGPLPDLAALSEDAGPLGSAEERIAWQAMAEEDRDAVNRAFANIGKALAAFVRAISHEETRFDRFAAAVAAGRTPEGDAAFTAEEIDGLRLFIGKANCIACHNGPRFTDGNFHNTGVPQAEDLPPDRGRAAAIAKVEADPFNCLGRYSDGEPETCRKLSSMAIDGSRLLRAFKTPSLRGATDRPPYMHAGQIESIEAVIDHYSRAPASPAGRSELRPVMLSAAERKALIAFLRTLLP